MEFSTSVSTNHYMLPFSTVNIELDDRVDIGVTTHNRRTNSGHVGQCQGHASLSTRVLKTYCKTYSGCENAKILGELPQFK